MPVYLDPDLYRQLAITPATANAGAEVRAGAPKCIHIGLVNNMPDGALQATERQFLRLLESASAGYLVRLSLYGMPDLPRGEAGRSHVERFYASVEELWDEQLDGLIVTGTEPKSPNLAEEPYWNTFCRVFEWAERNTYSSVWSCLAAHAALLKSDGIARRRLPDKRFGVFECAQAAPHPLTAAAPDRFCVPHSRWNDIDERDLSDCGYRILTRLREGGVDSFVKRQNSLLVFFQGHPEYEGDSLALEYRRDVRRFLRGERETYPRLPHACFDDATAREFVELEQRALSGAREEVLEHFTHSAEAKVANTWHASGARVYQSWLAFIAGQKEQRARELRGRKMSLRAAASSRRRYAGAAAD